MEYPLEVRNLELFLGKQHVLKNVSLRVPGNKITVILGPSGCGKTSLLKCMNRLIDLNEDVRISGSILIDGIDICHPGVDVTEIRRKMGLVSQRPYPLPMSIFENVAYGLRINGMKGKKRLAGEVKKYLEAASLWDEVATRLHEPAAKLSIGQQQRLCLARGLAVQPGFILADEPSSALDPISAAAIERKFIELKQNYTIVLVTHILRQARRLADHVVFLYMGEVVEQGPAKEVFENPKAAITRSYLQGDFN